ncbi:MAG: iron-containing alcohol dehydrogenase [Chloroflexi bacterium]|nr:iron-containing alcohol dehydrogenase [Chloroflexota bacterium]
MSVWPLPRITTRELSSIEEKRPVALLTNQETWAVLSSQLTLPVVIQAEPERYDRALFDYLADNLPSAVQAVYAVGEGAAQEAAKIVAGRNRKPLIIIPTALDSDAMLRPAARVQGQDGAEPRLIWQETSPAAEIIVDWGIIHAAPSSRRGVGIVDVISIVTALLDWRHAAQKGKNPPEQRFAPWAASVAAGLASHAIKSAAAIGQGHVEALRTLLDLMMLAVQLDNQLGHARAQAGGEHYLAQALLAQDGSGLHPAEALGPCILLLSALHGQDPAALRAALESAGVPLDRLRATDVRLVLNDWPRYVDAYDFPYSLLSEIDPASDEVRRALETAGLAIEPETWLVPDGDTPTETDNRHDPPPLQPVAPEQPAAPPSAEAQPLPEERPAGEDATRRAPLEGDVPEETGEIRPASDPFSPRPNS